GGSDQARDQRMLNKRIGIQRNHDSVCALIFRLHDCIAIDGFAAWKVDRTGYGHHAQSVSSLSNRGPVISKWFPRCEKGGLLQGRKYLAQQRDPLAMNGGLRFEGNAGEIAAGMREALDQSLPNRIDGERHDGYRAGCPLEYRACPNAKNNIWL